jgi:hypothetical protein
MFTVGNGGQRSETTIRRMVTFMWNCFAGGLLPKHMAALSVEAKNDELVGFSGFLSAP